LNHANNIANDAGLTTDPVITVQACEDTAGLLDGGLPANYTIQTGTGTAIEGGGVGSEGGSSTCTVEDDNDNTITATFTAYGVQ